MAQCDAPLTGDQVVGLTPAWSPGSQHSFVEIDHEVFSTVIPPFH